jgi:hypothetical protein
MLTLKVHLFLAVLKVKFAKAVTAHVLSGENRAVRKPVASRLLTSIMRNVIQVREQKTLHNVPLATQLQSADCNAHLDAGKRCRRSVVY